MSSFVQIPTSDWQKLCNEIAFIKEGLRELIQPSTKWISERAAMSLLGIKDKRTMRKKAIENNINFSCEGKRYYKYLHIDIENFLQINSTL